MDIPIVSLIVIIYHVSVNPSCGFSVVLRAKREILEGEEVTIQVQSYLALLSAQCERAHAQYVPPSLGQPARQHHLAQSWYMECDCKRCEDASEFGTFVSAVKVCYLKWSKHTQTKTLNANETK